MIKIENCSTLSESINGGIEMMTTVLAQAISATVTATDAAIHLNRIGISIIEDDGKDLVRDILDVPDREVPPVENKITACMIVPVHVHAPHTDREEAIQGGTSSKSKQLEML